MRFLVALALLLSFSSRASAILITPNQPLEIVGPWSSIVFSVTAYIDMNATATFTTAHLNPDDSADTESYFIAEGSVSAPGALVNYASLVGALAPLEITGNNYYNSCTSCSGNAQVTWFSGSNDPLLTVFANFYTVGLDVSNVQMSIDLELPSGFSIASPVPEPATWAMMLIGFAALGFLSSRSRVFGCQGGFCKGYGLAGGYARE